MANRPQPEFDIALPDGEFRKKLAEGEFAEDRLASILSQDFPTIEVKDDVKFAETGNLFIEVAQSDGRGGKKKSGINVTEASWWCIWFTPESFIGFTPDCLKEFARDHGVQKNGGDNGNIGRVFPLTDFVAWMRKKWRRP